MKNEPHVSELQAIVAALTTEEKKELFEYRDRLVQSDDADFTSDGDD